MKWLRRAAAIALLTLLVPAQAAVHGTEKSQRLVSEGNALFMQGQYQAAKQRFAEAQQASPEASAPLSAYAHMLYELAVGDATPQGEAQLTLAREWAQRALRLAEFDPVANEILRALDDETPRSRHVPNAESKELQWQGQILELNGRHEAAREKYRAAYRLDAKDSQALVFEANSFSVENNWTEATRLLEKALATDPLNSQAWRILSEARDRQGDGDGASQAILMAIASMPSEVISWEHARTMSTQPIRPLFRLSFKRRAWTKRSHGGAECAVKLASESMRSDGTMESAVWLAYASSLCDASKSDGDETPFQREVRAWSTALDSMPALVAQGKGGPPAQYLRTLHRLHKAGQLEVAILLLLYKEAYRPEFETWKKAHPKGILEFIEAQHLMP